MWGANAKDIKAQMFMQFTHTVLCGLLPRQLQTTDKGLIGFMKWLLAAMSKSSSACVCACVFSQGTNERHPSFWPLSIFIKAFLWPHTHTHTANLSHHGAYTSERMCVCIQVCLNVCVWRRRKLHGGQEITNIPPVRAFLLFPPTPKHQRTHTHTCTGF